MKPLDGNALAISIQCKQSLADQHLPHMLAAMTLYDIQSLGCVSAWLATLGHESMGLAYKREIADGSAYEGRLDLGNRFPGDGKLFPGRGWIQLTGRDAYEAYARYKKVSVAQIIRYLETDEGAADSAGWFWRGMPYGDGTAHKKKPWDLNLFAEQATWGSFYELQIRVNGRSKTVGMVEGKQVNLPNGWADRCSRWVRTWSILE